MNPLLERFLQDKTNDACPILSTVYTLCQQRQYLLENCDRYKEKLEQCARIEFEKQLHILHHTHCKTEYSKFIQNKDNETIQKQYWNCCAKYS